MREHKNASRLTDALPLRPRQSGDSRIAGWVSERNLLSGIGAGEGGVGHGEVGWVGVWGEGGGENLGK